MHKIGQPTSQPARQTDRPSPIASRVPKSGGHAHPNNHPCPPSHLIPRIRTHHMSQPFIVICLFLAFPLLFKVGQHAFPPPSFAHSCMTPPSFTSCVRPRVRVALFRSAQEWDGREGWRRGRFLACVV